MSAVTVGSVMRLFFAIVAFASIAVIAGHLLYPIIYMFGLV